MNIDEWLNTGITAGYCGPPICQTHDGTPMTADEENEFFEGYDPCLHIIRLYPDKKTHDAVEANHPPSKWRK